MNDTTPEPQYGFNFEKHPILSKLSTFDRIAFSAELASEINMAYAAGFNNALVNLGELIKAVAQRGGEDFSPNTHHVLKMVFDMIDRANEIFLDLYQNQESSEEPNT